jgi:hypothetical protein
MKTVIIAATTGLMLCATACSSSKSGTSGFQAAPRHGGVAVGGKPTSGIPAGSTTRVFGGGGGSNANAWCAELDKAGPAVITAGNPNALPPDWQAKAEALAADAPDDIRPDVETIIKADEQIINGNPNADGTQAFLVAGEHLVRWLGANCPGLLQKYNPGLPVGSSTNG